MKKGLLLIIIAGVMWGTSCLFVDLFTPYGFSGGQMTAIRLSLAFLGLLLYCLFFDRKALKVTPKKFLFLILCGAAMCAATTLYYEAIQLTSSSTAVVLLYVSPVPIMLFSVLFLGEKFNLKKGIATALMLLGCTLVSGIIGGFRPDPLGVAAGLGSALFYSLYNILNKISAKKHIDPFSTTLYTFLFAALFSILICRPQELPILIGKNPGLLIPMFFVHSLITCLLPYLIYTISLKYVPVGVASALCIIEPMTAALLGFLVLGDPVAFSSISGIILVIAAVFLLGISEGGLHLRFPHFYRTHNNKRFHFFRRRKDAEEKKS